MSVLAPLAPLRAHAGQRLTTGLDDATVERLAASHPDLGAAINAAADEYARLRGEFADLLDLDEEAQLRTLQAGYVNFYADDSVNPYVALAARGPWIVTLKGAVLYDTGGYGMLGLGHAPATVQEALARPQVMANIMTPSLSQLRFERRIRQAIGLRNGCPYAAFMCLNSGSEAVSLGTRIADVNAREMTEPGARHAGRAIKRVVVKGSFHGRTERPAIYSDSTRKTYQQYLASFRGEDSVIAVPPYDVAALEQAFADAEAKGWFIEALLLVDSIQAGLRTHGVLSIVDYPGFEDLPAPDMETYSKALNAGQFPLSVLAVNERAAALYRKGIYGNTMTTNPRALDVACAVLDSITPALRENIRARGAEALEKLRRLQQELGGAITNVQGTGLLFSCELAPEYKCYGAGSTEEWLRRHGLNVIHGGANSLRFTPHFAMDSEEVDLLVSLVGRALREGPRRRQAAAA